MYRLDFTTDPGAFLAETAAFLEADPVVSSVTASMAARETRARAEGVPAPDRPYWWLTVRDESGALVGVAMRTAPFAPYPLFVHSMPEDVARQLARVLHDRGEAVSGVNGARPAADTVAGEIAWLTGGRARVEMHTRLFELDELVDPEPVPGRLRAVRADEAELAFGWYAAFADAADEQAGRSSGHSEPFDDLDDMRLRIKDERVWFWVDADDRPVHVTGFSLPAFGVSRIGPVYTPAQFRGRGFAGNAVAEVSRMIQRQGARACLYTDQANPVSNRLYLALGYRAVVDQANLVIE